MKETWSALHWERKCALVVLAVGILLIAGFLWLATRPGIYHKGTFLAQQQENCWQGEIQGETVTVTRTQNEIGTELQIVSDSGKANYTLTGSAESLALYQDGQEVYRGRYADGMLLDENGELDMKESFAMSVTTSGGEVWIYEEGKQILDTPQRMSPVQAIRLLLGEGESTRGEPAMAIIAGILLIILFVDLWWPELAWWLNVRRWTSGDAEPSDWYYGSRILGHIVLGGGICVLLIRGL